MAKNYWVIRNISAVGFNAHSGSYVMGVPQLTAISGWLHSWMLGLSRETGREFNVNPEFIYAIESYGGVSGIALNTRSEKGVARAKRAIPAPIVDKPKSHVVFSIIVCWDGDGNSLMAPGISGGKIKNAIERSRLLGASLFMGKQEECVLLEESWEAATRRLGSMAFILSDASKQLGERMAELDTGSTREAICEMIARPKDGSYKARYVPVISGYQALGKAEPAAGESKEGAPASVGEAEAEGGETPLKAERHEQYNHAWVEPILSVGLFQSKASALKALRLGTFSGRWCTKSEPGLWRVAGVEAFEGADKAEAAEEDFFV